MVSCSASSTLSTYEIMSLMAYSSSHSCVGAPGDGGVVVYPCSPCPMMSGRSRSRDAWYLAGPLLDLWVAWWRPSALDKCVQGACSRGGGPGWHCAGCRRGQGPRYCLLRARVLAGFGPYAAPRPPCVGAPALAGCRCPWFWGRRGCSRVGVRLPGVVGVVCWRSGHEWGLVRGRASVLREAHGLAWLCCVVARWWPLRLLVSSPGAVRVVAGGGR